MTAQAAGTRASDAREHWPLFAGRTAEMRLCRQRPATVRRLRALPAWLPTYFVRYYDLPLEKAAPLAAVFLAIGGAGMVICGAISDRLVRTSSQRALLSVAYCLGCALMITVAMGIGPGSAQLVLLGFGMFLAAASAGPAGAMVADLTPAALHGTAFAVLTLANNAFGLAPGADPHRLAGRPHRPAWSDAVAAVREPRRGTGLLPRLARAASRAHPAPR